VPARWIVAELKRSGLTIADFAAKYELSAWRVYYWRKRLAEPSTSSEPKAALVEVRLPVPSGSLGPSRIEIELACGRRLCVAETIDPQRLQRLLAALEAPSC
jgi:transposase-like protein